MPKKTEIFELHNFRSNVQHWGIAPFSSEVVNRFDVYVSDFIREVLEQVFGLDFEDLFMSSLVKDETLRKILTIAEKAFERGDYKKSMRFADAAFNRALGRQLEEFGFRRALQIGPIEKIAQEVSILKLGLNYKDYWEYKKIAPHAIWDEDEGNIRYPEPLSGGKELEKKYSKENALFSLNFVLDCLLRWHL